MQSISSDVRPWNGEWGTRSSVEEGEFVGEQKHLCELLPAIERRGGVEDVLRLPVTVDTTPPTIDLVGIPAQINLERDEFINVIAEAEDNLSIDRVDFLLDGKPLGSATVSPYAIRWTPTDRQLGRHYIEAVAHDRAGNTTPAPRATIEVVKQR